MYYVTPREITWEALYSETGIFDSTASPENSGSAGCNEIPRCPMSRIVGDIVGFANGRTRKKRQTYQEVGPDVVQTREIKKRRRRVNAHGAEFESGRGRCWRRDILRIEDGKGGEMRWHEERDVCEAKIGAVSAGSSSQGSDAHVYTHMHTLRDTAHTYKDENDAREGERGNLARVWHTGLPVKTCEGRHQMLFRTRLSRSAAHTQCLGKIETGGRIMGARTGMVLPADRASRHGRLAPSCAPRENWKALGHDLRFRRNFKWAPKTGAPPFYSIFYIFSNETGALGRMWSRLTERLRHIEP